MVGHSADVLRLGGITIDCPDPDGLASFWAEALGYERRALWDPYAGARDPRGRDPNLTFQRAASANAASRLHIDLYADDPDSESARLVEIGAQRLRRVEEGDTWWWVLRDPGGNEFCVVAAVGEDRHV